MVDAVAEALAGEDAYVVGGVLRDELLGRPVVDLDVVCAEPEDAARRLARSSGGAPFALSLQHGGWRVVLDGGRTVDFTPLHGTIEQDLGRRDFTMNAMARPLAGGELVDPFGGREDIRAGTVRHVSEHVFDDDPVRLLRAVLFADSLGFALDPATESLVRRRADLVARGAGERVLEALQRLGDGGFALLDDLGLLAPLGGSLERLRPGFSPDLRLVAVFGANLERLPISNELRRFARTLLRAEPPVDDSPRAIHRFRRATEPWSLEALQLLGAPELTAAVEDARGNDPAAPLVRGDELGLAPGPEIGRLIDLIAEERAAGTISTKEEALELARRSTGALRGDS
jgi:tRNA nucleotidyltransferase/poly(A) polymerase